MRFKLKKQILEFPVGYIINVTDTGFGQLGMLPWGYEIPYFIMKAHPEWFEETKEGVNDNWRKI